MERGRHRDTSHGLGRRFSILWMGQIVSQFGDALSYFSIPLFVAFLSSQEELDLATTYTLDAIPAVIVGFFGGLIIDRLPLRLTMVVSDLARAAAFAYLAFYAASGIQPDEADQPVIVFVIAFLAGTFLNLFAGALLVLIKQLVGQDKLAEANARIVTVEKLAYALGPAAAGFLILLNGERYTLVFAVNALTFVASAIAIVMVGPVRRPSGPTGAPGEGLLADILNGLNYLWTEPRLRTTTVATAVANLAVGFLEATLVLIATEVVGADDSLQVGLMYGTVGLGAAMGAFLAPGFIRWFGLGRTLIGGLFTLGLGFAVFVSMDFGVGLLFYMLITFIGSQLFGIPLWTIRQTFTPDVMLGRVLTASRAIGWAPLPLGAVLGVALQSVIGFETVVRLAPFLIIVAAVGMIPTVVWSDTFGPITTGDHPSN